MKKQNKTIGILGGMGPQASAYLYKLLIDMSVAEFGVRNNDEFPEVLLYSIPVPDFISNTKAQSEALKMLKVRTHGLNNIGVGQIGIACNTAHVLLDELQSNSNVQFVSMIEEVARAIKENVVGLLATPTMLKLGIYQRELNKQGIKVVLPNQKQKVILEKIIRKIVAGEKVGVELEKIADTLVERGAKAIILGCTELPLVFPKNYKMSVYSSSEALARALLRNYYN